MPGLRDVCVELDNITEQFFLTLDTIYENQTQLESLMRNGFSHMAKARYIMGAKSVGKLQYNIDELEEASIHVDVNDDNDKHVQFCESISSSPSTDIAENVSCEAVQTLRKRIISEEPDQSNVEDISSEIKKVSLNDDDKKCDADTEKSLKSGKSVNDPMKWFGVLVPQSLRQSQKSFQQVIALTSSLATLQHKLLMLKERFQKLDNEKAIMLK